MFVICKNLETNLFWNGKKWVSDYRMAKRFKTRESAVEYARREIDCRLWNVSPC